MKPKKERYKTGEKALSPEEYKLILKEIVKLEDQVLIKLAVSTGARREDLVRIKWADVNEEESSISFYQAKKKRIHKVYVSKDIMQLLKMYYNSLANKKQKDIFPYCGRTAYNRLRELCEKAGIPKRPFHALRATCIKFSKAAGWSAEETARHVDDSVSTIQEHYSTPSVAEMSEAAQNKPII